MIKTLKADYWDQYELLDSGNSQRLEKLGGYILVRPDPQALWQPHLPVSTWQQADWVFQKTSGDKGRWVAKKPNLPTKWTLQWNNLKFLVKLSPFKHTGVFPEQAAHWAFIQNTIQKEIVLMKRGDAEARALKGRPQRSEDALEKPKAAGPRHHGEVNILNLFGYTGISSLAALSMGAKVTHVDGSYPTIGWFQENLKASNLTGKQVRWILDDCLKFVQRELKRGIKYDGIIMDPPIYGHGPKGETWDFQKDFPKLLELCIKLLDKDPLFIIINTYAQSSSSLMLKNLLADYLETKNAQLEVGELVLEEKDTQRLLSTGIYARWSKSL